MPIPQATFRCDHNCCTRTFIPLETAYARTIHKFQGLSAGPVDEGKVPNLYQCIICDPDEKKFEGTGALGLLYTAISRGTTLGDDNGLNSAVYFEGPDFRRERIQRITKMKDSNQDFLNAQKRQKWVTFLKKQERQSQEYVRQILRKKKKVFAFFKTNVFDYDFLYERIQKYKLESGSQTLF